MKLCGTVERLRNQWRWTVVLLDCWLVVKSRKVGADLDWARRHRIVVAAGAEPRSFSDSIMTYTTHRV
jgi:hypothetical protein